MFFFVCSAAGPCVFIFCYFLLKENILFFQFHFGPIKLRKLNLIRASFSAQMFSCISGTIIAKAEPFVRSWWQKGHGKEWGTARSSKSFKLRSILAETETSWKKQNEQMFCPQMQGANVCIGWFSIQTKHCMNLFIVKIRKIRKQQI